jgi:hypothetical protein
LHAERPSDTEVNLVPVGVRHVLPGPAQPGIGKPLTAEQQRIRQLARLWVRHS